MMGQDRRNTQARILRRARTLTNAQASPPSGAGRVVMRAVPRKNVLQPPREASAIIG